MDNKIDISSTAIEKGIDFAKDFLDKLIGPSIEETGLLIKDRITVSSSHAFFIRNDGSNY